MSEVNIMSKIVKKLQEYVCTIHLSIIYTMKAGENMEIVMDFL